VLKQTVARVAIGLLLIAGRVTGSVAEPPVSPLLGSSDSKVLAFGDSLTDGVGGSGENYPARLSRLIGRPVLNAGLPGDTTADGPRRLVDTLRRERPTLLILCLGINDLLQGIDSQIIHDNLLTMIRLSMTQGVPVLLVAVPQPGSRHAHPLYAQAALEGGAWLDEDAMVQVLSNPLLKADLVHPNGEGHRAIAQSLSRRLRQLGLVASL
jgi:acyl-CoA thioesterase I